MLLENLKLFYNLENIRISGLVEFIEKEFDFPVIVLFGSYSKGTETKRSDIDLIIICIPGKEKEVESFIKSLKHKYGINFSPVVLPLHEFPNIKKDNPKDNKKIVLSLAIYF